jgi:23S rRNA (cytosine1962-C5)-methyltransferase
VNILNKAYNYEFLDSGRGKRLEQIGDKSFIRQAPQADFSPLTPELWNSADFIYDKDASPVWSGNLNESSIPDFQYRTIKMEMRLSENGQIGIYPEQKDNWDWLYTHLSTDQSSQRILNGFAYTGASSLVCASAASHAEVCHLDASKAAVNWARVNREKSGLPDDAVRFIVDDISVFLEREKRRGNKYSGMILDPPAFGRAKGGKTWVLKRDLPHLMELCKDVLEELPRFFLLSCHDPEFSKQDLAALTASVLGIDESEIDTMDLILSSHKGNSMHNGIAARWYRS